MLDDENEWVGPKLLFMAGIFSRWFKESDVDRLEPIYNYTIITRWDTYFSN